MPSIKEIEINKIVVPPRIRQPRDVPEGLLMSIRKEGLIEPILVTPAKNGDYILVHGLYRLLAFRELQINKIPCVIDEDIDTKGLKITEMICNHPTPYTIGEIVEFCTYLETQQRVFVASEIEEMVYLKPGQYLKLKAVLESGMEDIVENMLKGSIDIDKAFRQTEKRKRENELALTQGNPELDFAGLDPVKLPNQKVGKRHRLDPALRKAIEARDNFTCQCCGKKGMVYSKAFEVHHIIPVYLDGKDEEGNLILLCPTCHKLVGLHGFGELYIPHEYKVILADKNAVLTGELLELRKIVELGNIIRNGISATGRPIDEFKAMEEELSS